MTVRTTQLSLVAVLLLVVGCSEESRDSISSDVDDAVTAVSEAIEDVGEDAAEAAARNIATQQGEEQFANADIALDGALTCEATVQDDLSVIEVSCTGRTEAGELVELIGTTDEIPGASVVELSGEFVGTVDGATVFETETLGG
jgi:uncharacterized membrane protein YdfJ with MMPL/SSD domain